MRISKKVTVADREITVTELTLQQIAELAELSINSPAETIAKLLSMATDVDSVFILQRTPSEIAPVVDAMLEVNADFFRQAGEVGMVDAAKEMESMIRKIFIVAFLPSSAPDTVQ